MVIDVARNLAGLEGANSREVDPTTPAPVIDLMSDQQDVAATAATDWLIDRLATEGLRDER